MIKYAFTLIVVCLYVACRQPAKQTTATAPITDTSHKKSLPIHLMITPGGGIGRITIGENADSTISLLGKPDNGDAGMGAQLITWYTNHNRTGYQINVYAHRNMGNKDEAISRVRAIRVTSPAFTTSENLHTGLPFNEIRQHFNLYRKTPPTKSGLITYDDTKAGIAFEVNNKNICTAIIVFARGSNSGTYLNMRQ